MTEKKKAKTGLLVNLRMSVNLWSDVARGKKKGKKSKDVSDKYLMDDFQESREEGEY